MIASLVLTPGWWLVPAGITVLLLAGTIAFAVAQKVSPRDDDHLLWVALLALASWPILLVWCVYLAACVAAGRVL